MGFGIDYSYGSGLTAPKMKKEGVTFVARYLATLPNSKCINKAEADNLIKAGIRVVLVWETTADRVLSGHGGGVADAKEADRQASSLGMKGIPI
jgi:glycoside hydrolase-like protein